MGNPFDDPSGPVHAPLGSNHNEYKGATTAHSPNMGGDNNHVPLPPGSLPPNVTYELRPRVHHSSGHGSTNKTPRAVMYKGKLHDFLIYASLLISALALILATRKSKTVGLEGKHSLARQGGHHNARQASLSTQGQTGERRACVNRCTLLSNLTCHYA